MTCHVRASTTVRGIPVHHGARLPLVLVPAPTPVRSSRHGCFKGAANIRPPCSGDRPTIARRDLGCPDRPPREGDLMETIEVDAVEVRYEISGDGEPVVCLHANPFVD